MKDVAAHTQQVSNRYIVAYPAHPPRSGDPHYVDFEAFRRRTRKTAKCAYAVEVGCADECAGGLELHHAHLEFALQNGVDLHHLEHAYPGISDPLKVGAWVESAANLIWLCEKHHRGAGTGVHHLSASDYEASKWTAGVFGDEAK